MALVQLVEDQPSQQALVRLNLEKEGYKVLSANNAKEALQQAKESRPDLVLLNIMLPDIGGLDVLSQFKKISGLQDTPVIIISSRENEDDITTALDLGAQDYVTKPLNLSILNARVRNALRLSEDQQSLREANQKLGKMAAYDSLTGLYNRRVFIERMEEEISKAQRTGRNLSLIMLDTDHFKKINDQYGHVGGDRVLCTLSQILANTVRHMDLPARIGGEEFAVICPETDLAGAMLLAERLREKFESKVVTSGKHSIHFTASFGIGELQTNDKGSSPFIQRCDELLYQAKSNGRNKVCY